MSEYTNHKMEDDPCKLFYGFFHFMDFLDGWRIFIVMFHATSHNSRMGYVMVHLKWMGRNRQHTVGFKTELFSLCEIWINKDKGLQWMSDGDVIHRIITGTKQQPGGGWGGGVTSPYLWEGVTYRKVSQHTLVSKDSDIHVARDK